MRRQDTKFIFWISRELLAKLKAEAREEGLTLSEVIRGLLRAWLEKLAEPRFGDEN
jgi:hypothetical protein